MLSAALIAAGRSRFSGAVRVNERGNQLDMRRPDELIDWLDGDEAIAAGDEDAGIAREARGVARYSGQARHAGAGKRCRLGLGPDPRGVEDDGAVIGKLLGVERATLEVARLGRYALGEARAPRRLADRRC